VIRFSCPSCGTPTSVPDNFAGQSGTCNSCGASIVAPGFPTNFIPSPPVPSRPSPYSASRDVPGHDPAVPTININPPLRGMSTGTVSVILGVLAILICWVPLLNFFSIILGGLGGIVAIIAALMAVSNKWIGFPAAFLGIVLNGTSFFVSMSMMNALTGIVDKERAESEARLERSKQALTMPSSERHASNGYPEDDPVQKAARAASLAREIKKQEATEYMHMYLVLTSLERKNFKDIADKRKHPIKGMVKNNGLKTVNHLEMTVYFYDLNNVICGENASTLIGRNGGEPLKPGHTIDLNIDLPQNISPTWSGNLRCILTDCDLE